MKQIIFILLFFTACTIVTSCKKVHTALTNSYVNNPPPPTPTYNGPSIFFWTRDTWLTTEAKLYVNINNQTQILDEGWAGSGDAGCYPYNGQIKFDLPAGQYAYKTWRQGRDTITGAVTVVLGICNSVQINY